MDSKEILDLHSRIDERMAARDTIKDDKSIAQISEQEGWEVLKGLMESMIAELLSPVDFADTTPLDVRGSVGDARKFGIEVLQKVIGIVESTKSANRIEKLEKPPVEELPVEESKPEA